jgi:hypothetical protein
MEQINGEITGLLIGATLESFTDSKDKLVEWVKTVLLGEGGLVITFSLDKKVGLPLIEQVGQWAKKDVIVSGYWRLDQETGWKFKGQDIELIKK